MPIITAPQQFNEEALYVDLRPIVARSLYLKVEGFNFASSIKMKAAVEMVERLSATAPSRPRRSRRVLVGKPRGGAEHAGREQGLPVRVRHRLALQPRDGAPDARARHRGARRHRALEQGGLLGARLAHVHDLCASDERYLWLNQYANPANPLAHYRMTAPRSPAVPRSDVLFVGAGTCGTLMGCARYMRNGGAGVRIVAVDTVGSVIFGGPADAG